MDSLQPRDHSLYLLLSHSLVLAPELQTYVEHKEDD